MDTFGKIDENKESVPDVAAEKRAVLAETFGLAPETVRVVVDDAAATGMRKPASDDVELDRIESANNGGMSGA